MSEETANSANSAENTDANLRIMQGGHSAEHWFHRYLAAQERYEISRRRLREAEAERDALREALNKIAATTYGLELNDTDEYRLEYWSKLATEYNSIARAALSNEQGGKQ